MKRRPMHRRPEHHPDFDRAVRRFFHTCPASDVLERYDALGLGLGYKVKEGKVLDTLSLRVYVPEKTKKGKAPKNADKVDKVVVVHTDGGDELRVPTDVETGRIAVVHRPDGAGAHSEFVPTDRVDVLVGGVQISTIDHRSTGFGVGRGTLGGWAWDTKRRQVVLLSNAHVLGQHDGHSSVHITQPSNPHTARKIAELAGSAGYFGDEAHTVDAAIGARLNMKGVNMSVHAIGPAIMATAEPGMLAGVEKFGVSTGHTSGSILNNYWMGYLKTGAIGGKSSERKFFRSCMRIGALNGQWADHGDSGALVFAKESLPGSDLKPVIGLHFAGEEGNAQIGFACRIHEVFRALDLSSLAEGALSIVLSAIPLDETREARARAALGAFFAGVPDAGETRVLHEVITKHRARLADLIIGDPGEALQRSAASVLKLIVGNGQTVDDICRTPLAGPLLTAIDECCTAFADRSGSPELATALKSLQALIDRNQGRTLADALAFARQTSDAAGAAAPSAGATFDDVVAYLEAYGKAELIDRYDAVGAEPYRDSDSTHGIELTREPQKPGAPKLPSFVEWNRDGKRVAIPLRERAGGVAV